MMFKVSATWRRPDGSEAVVTVYVEAGDACEAVLSAWPAETDRPCSHASITIDPVDSSIS